MFRSFRIRVPKLLLLISLCYYFILIKGLQLNALSGGEGSTSASFKSSPAAVAIQDGNTVRNVLKNRTTRGKASPISKSEETRELKDNEPSSDMMRKGNDDKSSQSSRIIEKVGLGPSRKGISLPYSLIIKALRVYHENHSNLILPRRYVLPESTDYPKELAGIDLAATVYDMKWWQRHVKHKPDRVAELNELGFVWERLQPEWNLVLEGLVTYESIYNNLLVPSKFVVPHDDKSWPKATWGLALGNCVYRIRNRGDFLGGYSAWSRRDQLDSIGFVWDTSLHKFELFCRALRSYSKIEVQENDLKRVSAMRVPSKFVIPENDDNWPKDLWGYKLGEKCTAVRQKQLYIKGHPERFLILADIGFYIGGNDTLSWLEVVHAAAVYSQMNGRKLDVPSNFVVPAPPKHVLDSADSEQPWQWPEYLWGFPLGQRLKDIRLKGYYMRGKASAARRSQLDALGFVWEPSRGRPKKSSS